ncbi:MAG: transketolase [Desulfomonile tiedjei]|nr:transketolase [Desulfomonile tiedjei]
MNSEELDRLCIDTLRFLAVDAVQKAESGHPGLPLGSAPMFYVVWDRFLKYNPENPQWPNRDRFVLSAGHGCALLYAMLHVAGFDLSLEELQRFRQWESRTPGHPEYGKTPGVEATTGPLGQGLANAVGMAIAETALAARFNRPDFAIVDHYTYVEASDGDLMEGVSSEAASLAGHLRLGKLIVLYDDNHISIEGSTNLAFTENRVARFAAFGWHAQQVADGNELPAIHAALEAARENRDQPSFIAVHSHIGFGSPHKQDTAEAHGEPLGEKEVRLTKLNLGWPTEPPFYVPDEARDHFRQAIDRGKRHQAEWESLFQSYSDRHPELAAKFHRVMQRKLPANWDSRVPKFTVDQGPMATRVASGKALNAIAPFLPELMGGSADLAPSTKTLMAGAGDFEADDRFARNIHFGVREHAMGSIANGLALHGGIIPYAATFLIFSDYMRPPIRLAALTDLHVIYVFTHDSIGLGEDGPTHQPVEQLLGLRAIPNMVVIRPADANETAAAWRIAIQRPGPVALALTRQNLPVLDSAIYAGVLEGVQRGGYLLAEAPNGGRPDIVLVASGSEVHLAIEAREKLLQDGVRCRVVSLPSWNLFDEQSEEYRSGLFPSDVPVLAIEAGVSLGWRPYLGRGVDVIAVDRFGASAPGKKNMQEYGFTVENICERAFKLLKHSQKT